jgi:hypothetical protein
MESVCAPCQMLRHSVRVRLPSSRRWGQCMDSQGRHRGRLWRHSPGQTSATPFATCRLAISDIASRLFWWLSSNTPFGTPRKCRMCRLRCADRILSPRWCTQTSGRRVSIGSELWDTIRAGHKNYIAYSASEWTGPTSDRRRNSPRAKEVGAGAARFGSRSQSGPRLGLQRLADEREVVCTNANLPKRPPPGRRFCGMSPRRAARRWSSPKIRSTSRRLRPFSQRDRRRRFRRELTPVAVRSSPEHLLRRTAKSASSSVPRSESTKESSASVQRRQRLQPPHVPQRGRRPLIEAGGARSAWGQAAA